MLLWKVLTHTPPGYPQTEGALRPADTHVTSTRVPPSQHSQMAAGPLLLEHHVNFCIAAWHFHF